MSSSRARTGRPAKRAKAEPSGGGELARALNWLNSYNKVGDHEQRMQGCGAGCWLETAGRAAPVLRLLTGAFRDTNKT